MRVGKVGGYLTSVAVLIAFVAIGLLAFWRGTGFPGGSDATTGHPGVASPADLVSGKSGPRQDPAPMVIANPDGSTVFSGVGAIVRPAPSGVTPTVSIQRADAILETTPAAPQGLEGLVPSSIRLVDYENEFGTSLAGDTDRPSVRKQLAWFAEYDSIRRAINLPIATNRRQQPPAMTSNRWVVVVLLSASTGAVLDAFDYSR